jgi:hypothetical protein
MYGFIHEDFRVATVRPFPYAVIYAIEGKLTTVYAIIHTAQDEGVWLNRLTRDKDN